MRPLGVVLLMAVAANAAPAALVERVEVDAARPVVRLRLSQPVAPGETQSIPAREGRPPRIFVDLPGAKVGTVRRTTKGSGPVRRVRLGQYDRRTARVVIELEASGASEAPAATVSAKGRTVTIELAAPPPPSPAAAESAPPPMEPVSPSSTTVTPGERPHAEPAPPVTVPPMGRRPHGPASLASITAR